jgi:hypothetical protein
MTPLWERILAVSALTSLPFVCKHSPEQPNCHMRACVILVAVAVIFAPLENKQLQNANL